LKQSLFQTLRQSQTDEKTKERLPESALIQVSARPTILGKSANPGLVSLVWLHFSFLDKPFPRQTVSQTNRFPYRLSANPKQIDEEVNPL
jgi:hypothetical protein